MNDVAVGGIQPRVSLLGSMSNDFLRRDGSIMQSGTKVITVGELSDYLRVHRSTVYRLLKKGQLPGFKIGSDWRFNLETIDKWRMQGGAALDELSEGDAANIR